MQKDLFNLIEEDLLENQSHLQPQKQKIQNTIPNNPNISFNDYPLDQNVKLALNCMGYNTPTKVQAKSLEHSLKDKDLLCLSETGSGKTLAFVVPIVNFIAQNNNNLGGVLALILAPTRELCIQIADYFTRFQEAGISNCSCLKIYGGVDPMSQVIELAKKPTVIVATPGRILDHLRNTKGFHLKELKYLVLDEADKLLNKEFQLQFHQLLQFIPNNRITSLFSATLSHKIQQLQKVSLKKPCRVQVSIKYQTVPTLKQYYIFIPSKIKDCYTVYLLYKNKHTKTIVFTETKLGAERLGLVMQKMGFKADYLSGAMTQKQREIGLAKFKGKEINILVCTDLAARGIDIPQVRLIINYDLCCPKNYVHRVGRTARVGAQGMAISIVTQYNVEEFKKIEDKIGTRMPQYITNRKQVEIFEEKLEICHKQVSSVMKGRNG